MEKYDLFYASLERRNYIKNNLFKESFDVISEILSNPEKITEDSYIDIIIPAEIFHSYKNSIFIKYSSKNELSAYDFLGSWTDISETFREKHKNLFEKVYIKFKSTEFCSFKDLENIYLSLILVTNNTFKTTFIDVTDFCLYSHREKIEREQDEEIKELKTYIANQYNKNALFTND